MKKTLILSVLLSFSTTLVPVPAKAAIPIPGILGSVWIDANADGIWQKTGDNPELPHPGVQIKVKNFTTGQVVSSGFSSADGSFNLDLPLTPGDYALEQVLPENFTQTTPEEGFFDIHIDGSFTPITQDIKNRTLLFGNTPQEPQTPPQISVKNFQRTEKSLNLKFKWLNPEEGVTPHLFFEDSFGNRRPVTQAGRAFSDNTPLWDPVFQQYEIKISTTPLTGPGSYSLIIQFGENQEIKIPITR